MPDGRIYSEITAPALGTVEDSIYDLLIRELQNNYAWRKVRNLPDTLQPNRTRINDKLYAISSLHPTRCDGLRPDVAADYRATLRPPLLAADPARAVPYHTRRGLAVGHQRCRGVDRFPHNGGQDHVGTAA